MLWQIYIVIRQKHNVIFPVDHRHIAAVKQVPGISRWQQWSGKMSSCNWLEEVMWPMSCKNWRPQPSKVKQSPTILRDFGKYQFHPSEYQFHSATSYMMQFCSKQFWDGLQHELHESAAHVNRLLHYIRGATCALKCFRHTKSLQGTDYHFVVSGFFSVNNTVCVKGTL